MWEVMAGTLAAIFDAVRSKGKVTCAESIAARLNHKADVIWHIVRMLYFQKSHRAKIGTWYLRWVYLAQVTKWKSKVTTLIGTSTDSRISMYRMCDHCNVLFCLSGILGAYKCLY
jgi:hypothetical protein